MTDFTRVTVVGSTRKAELVVPNDESVGTLIPQLMDLLAEPTTSVGRPLTLVRSTGEQLDLTLSAAQQAVRDGELLRLLRIEDAPPPPEVSDVTDVVADSLAERTALWSGRYRTATGAVGVGVFAFVAAIAASGEPRPIALAALIVGWMVFVIAAVVLAAFGLRWSSIAATAAAIGVSPVLGFLLTAGTAPVALPSLGTMLLLAWVAIGLGAGVGPRNRPVMLGSLVGVVATALPVLLLVAGVPVTGAFGITAIATVAAVGLVPWYAMSASGLTGLDDQIVEGARRKRNEVLVTVNGAYRSMTWAVAGLALPAAAAATVLLTNHDGWSIGLGVATVLVLVLRTRAFPLAGQAILLWAAVLVPTAIGIAIQLSAHHGFGALAAVVAGAITCVLVGASPATHQRARLRRLGNLVEALAVVALLPLLLGVFNLYAQLLGTF